MNMRTHFGAIILSILFLHIFADAQTVQSTTEPTFSAEQLRDGAEKTYVNFNRAWQAGTEMFLTLFTFLSFYLVLLRDGTEIAASEEIPVIGLF